MGVGERKISLDTSIVMYAFSIVCVKEPVISYFNVTRIVFFLDTRGDSRTVSTLYGCVQRNVTAFCHHLLGGGMR